MICPHCQYEHEYNVIENQDKKGKLGDFYESPVKMERDSFDFRRETVRVYGCPDCKKIFIK